MVSFMFVLSKTGSLKIQSFIFIACPWNLVEISLNIKVSFMFYFYQA